MTIVVKDANGTNQTVKTINDLETSVALATKQDTGNGTLASILAKITADPATAAKQDEIVTAIEGISISGGGGGDATAANQVTGNTSLATIATNTTGAATAANQTTLNTVVGAANVARSTATDTTSVTAMQVWKQISFSIQAVASALAGTLTVATHAVTQSGSWVLSAGTALIGRVTVSDGTNHAVIRAGLSSAANSDAALVVAMRPDSVRDTYAEYETVAASQTAQVLGATGAVGDYLAGVLIIPATSAAGAVSIKDGTNAAVSVFAGGGTTALPTLAPIFVPLGIYSVQGAWQITTGANVSAIGIGDFT